MITQAQQLDKENLYKQALQIDNNDSLEVEGPEKYKRHWGNCKPYLFDENDQPIVVLGPHWPLFLVSFIFFAAISIVMIWFTISNKMSLTTIGLTTLVCLSQLSSYLLVALRNPGVAYKKEIANDPHNNQQSEQKRFCCICDLSQDLYTVHCSDCNICIEGMDHHCVWTGKCIGQGNLREFYGFLICTLTFMIFNIIVTMSQASTIVLQQKQ